MPKKRHLKKNKSSSLFTPVSDAISAITKTTRFYAKVVSGKADLTTNRELGVAKVKALDVELDCTVTTQAQRLVHPTSLFKAFKRPRKGEKRLPGMPAVIGAKNLAQFITPEIHQIAQPVHYINSQGESTYGYRAELVGYICILYSRAKRAGELHKRQYDIYERCMDLMEASVGPALVGMIDEAVGYKKLAGKMDLTRVFDQMIQLQTQVSAVPTDGMFPISFYSEMHRVYGHEFKGLGNTQQWVAKVTLRYIYGLLPIDVQLFLKESREFTDSGHPKYRLYQRLTDHLGYAVLRSHISEVTGILRICPDSSPEVFKEYFEVYAERKQSELAEFAIDTSWFYDEAA